MGSILNFGQKTIHICNPIECPTDSKSGVWFDGARHIINLKAHHARAVFYAKLTNRAWPSDTL